MTDDAPRFVVVFETQDFGLLHLVKTDLEANAIEVISRNEHLATQVHFGATVWAPMGLEVPAEDVDRARTVVDAFLARHRERGSDKRRVTCGGCGESGLASFDICWSCGEPYDPPAED